MISFVALLMLQCQAIPMNGWQRLLPGSSSSARTSAKVQDCYEPPADPVDPEASPEHPYSATQRYSEPELDFYHQFLHRLGEAEEGWQGWFHQWSDTPWNAIVDRCQTALVSFGQDPSMAEDLLNAHGNDKIGHILLLSKTRWHKIVARHLLGKIGITV